MQNPEDIGEKFSLPTVAAIIERLKDGETEILVDTRWKPDEDPKYSGCLEIPGGKIREFENIYDTIKREVLEETGLHVTKIKPDIKSKVHSNNDDGVFAFMPFCCQQQIKGGQPWIGFIFICEVEEKAPPSQGDDTKDIRWMKKTQLKKIFDESPQNIFTFQLGALDFYLNGIPKSE